MNLFPLTPTAALVMQLLDSKTSTTSAFESNTFKPEYKFEINSTRLERCTPEEEGIHSEMLTEFLEKLQNDRTQALARRDWTCGSTRFQRAKALRRLP